MKNIYFVSIIIGIQLLVACKENNEKINDNEQVSKSKREQETKWKVGDDVLAEDFDWEKAALVLFDNGRFEILRENQRNSTFAQSIYEKNRLNGVICIYIEKFYGPGDVNVPIILYVSGSFNSIKIGDVQQSLSQGENFISVPWIFQRGYNRIPVTAITPNESFNCGIEISFN